MLIRLVAVAVAGALLAGCSHASRRALPPSTTSPTVAPVATTTTVPYVIYRVRPGDTLSKIAGQYRVSASSIAALNHISNPDLLAEGRTLKIPPAPPLELAVRPATGTLGEAFRLTLTGAPPNEPVTFEVHSPRGTFTGPQHIASADGTVSATYQTGSSDATGTYIVVARGNAGPITNAKFVVTVSTPAT
jgi:LysM repeat protein